MKTFTLYMFLFLIFDISRLCRHLRSSVKPLESNHYETITTQLKICCHIYTETVQ